MSAKPHSALGRVLLKGLPDRLADKAVVAPMRKQLADRVLAVRTDAATLPFPGIVDQMNAELDGVEADAAVIDSRTSATSRSKELTQLNGRIDATAAKIVQARARAADRDQLADRLRAARAALSAEPDTAARTALTDRLGKLDRGLTLATSSGKVAGLDALAALTTASQALDKDITEAKRLRGVQEGVAAALPALRQRCQTALAIGSSSPALQALQGALRSAEAAVPNSLTPDNAVEAARLVGLFATAAGKVEAKAAEETAAYDAALEAATRVRAAIVAPAVRHELPAIDAALAAAALRATTDRHAAKAELDAVLVDCARVKALADAAALALSDAEAALLAAKPKMMPTDAAHVQADLIDVAKTRAAAGERQAALDLLAQVGPYCAAAAAADLPGRYPTRGRDLAALVSHPQRAAFAAEIERLTRRLETVKTLLAAGTTNGADKEMDSLHFDARRQRGLADLHQTYVTARDLRTPRLDQLKTDEPVASNAGIAGELTELEELLARADKRAAKRLYDAAHGLLTQADARIAAAAAQKRAHAVYAEALLRVTPRAQALAGSPDAGDADAARASLTLARTKADADHDFAAALALLERAERQCAACEAVAATAAADAGTRDSVLAGLDDDVAGALREVREWLERLRTGPGHEALSADIAAIEGLLAEADAALAD